MSLSIVHHVQIKREITNIKSRRVWNSASKVTLWWLLSYSSEIDDIICKMDDYTALSDDSFEDFIVSGNCQEKQNSKDIEGTNFKILSRIYGKISPANSPWRNSFFSKVKV